MSIHQYACRLTTAATVISLLSGCSGDGAPTQLRQVRNQAHEVFEDDGCYPNGCALSGGFTMAQEAAGEAPAGTPNWLGEPVEEMIGGAICPPWVENLLVQAFPKRNGVQDATVFRFPLLGPPMMSMDTPQHPSRPTWIYCYYPINTWIRSVDGRYEIVSGKLLVETNTKLGVVGLGKIVYNGYVRGVVFEGEIYPRSESPGNGQGGRMGYGYIGSYPTSINRGTPFGWQDAAEQWVYGGGCRPGWDIWFNGVQVCSGGTPPAF
jgi:hypothetical protein